jgi:poly-gamma-glutamate capsule biosynthesis protein CapA/YwtB (metallophosphatase superfamily)
MTGQLLGFVGDVLIDRDDPAGIFDAIRDVLGVPAVLFANLEGVYTDDPRPVPGAVGGISAPAKNLDAYADAGFAVMSLANNHVLDVGYDAMLTTRARLNAQGIRTCGAGGNLDEAREPAIVDAGGLRVAYLGYASVFPLGCEARPDAPGLAPLRAYNLYRNPFPTIHTPGAVPDVTTVPEPIDLANLDDDIARARDRADLVVTSFHWGDTTRPYHLTDHEVRTARHCIDQGADLVVGHHHHALRGMEWYRGKPIMYGLGHFVFDMRIDWTDDFLDGLRQLYPSFEQQRSPYTPAPREGWPLLPMHEDTRMTALAWATADSTGITDIGFLPCHLTPDGLVHPLRHGTPEDEQVVRYFEQCIASQDLDGAVVAGGPALAGYQTLRVVPRSQLGNRAR